MRRLSSTGDTNGDLNNGTPLPVHKSSPVAIAKLKGSVGLNDPGQRELLKLCLSLTLAWSMVHGPSWSNSCSFTLLHAPSWSFVVLHVQNEMCGRAQLPATSCLWSKLATPAHEIAVTAFIQGVLHKHGTLFPRRVGNRNHHIPLFNASKYLQFEKTNLTLAEQMIRFVAASVLGSQNLAYLYVQYVDGCSHW